MVMVMLVLLVLLLLLELMLMLILILLGRMNTPGRWDTGWTDGADCIDPTE